MIFVIIIIFLLLSIAAYTDTKTMEVPLWIPSTAFVTQTAYYGIWYYQGRITKDYIFSSLLIASMLFLMTYFVMHFGNLGGADCLLCTFMGYHLNYMGIYVVMLSFILTIPYCLFEHRKKQTKDYPFVPYILASYLLILLALWGAVNLRKRGL